MDTDTRSLVRAVIMPGFAATTVPPWLARELDGGLGGVCYFGHNIDSPDQVRDLSRSIHALGDAVIAVDEEGGIVTRLHTAEGSPHVGAAVLGRADDLAATRQTAREIAAELRRAEIDVDLAPVVDINSNPGNPVIGVRSFGATPALVSRHAAAFITELQAGGVAACAKHYPGHGDTSVDSHSSLPVVGADLATLRSRELVPFAAAVDAGVRCVMTAHIVFPAIDTEPATLSPALLSILRSELGFDGTIISDALDMQAISSTVGVGEAAVRALLAGVDLVALGNPVLGKDDPAGDEAEFLAAHDAVAAAVREGRLPVARLEQAAGRVRELAAWTSRRREVPADEGRSSAGQAAPAVEVATRALRTRGDVAGALGGPVHVLDIRRQRNIASGRLSGLLGEALADRLPGSRVGAAFATGGAEGRVTDADGAGRPASGSPGHPDVVITGTPGRDEQEGALLDRLLAQRPDTVVVCLGWSGDPDDLPGARRAVFAFGDSRPTVLAVTQLLTAGR